MRAIDLINRLTGSRARAWCGGRHEPATFWAQALRVISVALLALSCGGRPPQLAAGAFAGCYAQLRLPASQHAPELFRLLARLRLDTAHVPEWRPSPWDTPWRRLHVAQGTVGFGGVGMMKWHGIWRVDSLRTSLSLRLGLGAGLDVDSLRLRNGSLLRGAVYETGEGVRRRLGVATWTRVPCAEAEWDALQAAEPRQPNKWLHERARRLAVPPAA